MLRNKKIWYLQMFGSLVGWAFAIYGLVKPIEDERIKKVWKNVACIWGFGHPLELPVALAIGKGRGLSKCRTITKTLLFGFTWWLPLNRGIFKK